jgi:RluA family pseudouridine synthase
VKSTPRALGHVLHWFDDSILVLFKPSGWLSIPDGYDPDKSHLRSMLEPYFGRLWVVHRLDRGTSGLMVLARSSAAHRALNQQFERGEVEKNYQAIVEGEPAWSDLRLELALLPNGDRRHRTVPDAISGKPSRTDFTRLSKLGSHSWLSARIYTGRTHQVRAHCTALGHPVPGDHLYGARLPDSSVLIDRLGLHASRLRLLHPVLQNPMLFEVDPPPAMGQLWDFYMGSRAYERGSRLELGTPIDRKLN